MAETTTHEEVLTRYIVDVDQALVANEAMVRSAKKVEVATKNNLVAPLEEIPSATRKAEKGVLSLGEKLRAWSRQDAKEARVANYLIREFLAFMPATSLATKGVQAFGAALVGGLGLGVALEAVAFAAQYLGKVLAEQGKTEIEAIERTKKHREALLALQAAVEGAAAAFTQNTRADSFADDQLRGARQEMAKVGVEIDAIQAKLKVLSDGWFKGEEIKKTQEQLRDLEGQSATLAEKMTQAALATRDILVPAEAAANMRELQRSAEAMSRSLMALPQSKAAGWLQGEIDKIETTRTQVLERMDRLRAEQATAVGAKARHDIAILIQAAERELAALDSRVKEAGARAADLARIEGNATATAATKRAAEAVQQARLEVAAQGASDYERILLKAQGEVLAVERRTAETLRLMEGASQEDRNRVVAAGEAEKTLIMQRAAAERASMVKREGEQIAAAEFARLKAANDQYRQSVIAAVDLLAQHQEDAHLAALARKKNGSMLVELAQVDAQYAKLIEAATLAGEDEVLLEEQKEAEKQRIREKYQRAQLLAITQALLQESQAVLNVFLPTWQAAWSRAGTVNRRYQAEFNRLSMARRERQLVEMGVAQTAAEAHVIAAQEAQAAAQEQAAAEKQAVADRLAALAIEWSLKAIAAAADLNFPAAAAYAAAAAGAGAAASSLHSQARRMSNSRGYTAAERDSLHEQTSDVRESEERASGAGGSTTSPVPVPQVTREVIILVADPFETPAEAAQRAARRLKLAQDLDMVRPS